MKTDEIRKSFLEFFRTKEHTVVESDSLLPKDDPSLLFTGAGMNQFKEKFLGRNVTYRRAASSQKCLRTGDLENVGRTSGHHTFFEMLGNFSFGDYFKKEAIEWSWEFLTKVLKLESEDLWVSVYKDDAEAYSIWKDVIKIPSEKIKKFGEKENFWPAEAPTKGPNGPCGPCSEIYYKDLEVWNLVFTQFDRQDGSLKPLPSKNIDTGMGLERLASVIQGVKTNFEIDIFVPIVEKIEKAAIGKLKIENRKSKVNAIADHIRAVTFCIADGAMPSNEERGYVVRKLIRRAASHAKNIGIKEPFLYKLVNSVVEVMKAQYPELKFRRDDIAQVVKKEEENFISVITTQLPRVEEAFEGMRNTKDENKLAETAFNFYDTYGMPYEMLEEIAEKHGQKIDRGAFDSLLERQRNASRFKTKIKGEIFSETLAKKVEALGLKTEFVGYDKTKCEAKVLAVLGDGEVILDKTPFYGESGGQAGDRGRIETASGSMEVEDSKKIGQAIVHIGKMTRGAIKKNESAKAAIDEIARKKTMANHTATHLLQAALRKVLGEHVRQTGSLVDSEHLRFDFTHMKKMEDREVARVEEIVNENIKAAIALKKEVRDLEAAKKAGATALFGEEYEKEVRVISIGNVSKELCGGTHLDNTRDIGLFKITGESSIASGVRRIEALTGTQASDWMKKKEEEERSRLKAEGLKEEQKKLMAGRLADETGKLDDYISKGKIYGGVKLITEVIGGADMELLRALCDRLKAKADKSVIILSTRDESKVSFVVSVAKDLVKESIVNASDLAKELAKLLAGSGGGRPDFAQGGGKDPARLEGALKKINEIVEERLK